MPLEVLNPGVAGMTARQTMRAGVRPDLDEGLPTHSMYTLAPLHLNPRGAVGAIGGWQQVWQLMGCRGLLMGAEAAVLRPASTGPALAGTTTTHGPSISPISAGKAHCPVSTRAGILSFSRVAAFCPLPLSGLQPAAQRCIFCTPCRSACMMMLCAPIGGAGF